MSSIRLAATSIVAVLVLALFPTGAGATTANQASDGTSERPTTTSVRESGLTVTVQSVGDVTVHSLTSPEQLFANSTHIIETDNALVAIDTQFLLPNAMDMRAYADDLGKPLDRVFITHDHPDHFLGSEAFADVPVYALEEVSAAIAANGDAEVAEKQGDFGSEAIAGTYVVPMVVEPGSIDIDGVTFELAKVSNAEAEHQLVLRVPDYGVIAVGDLVYSGVHLIMAGPPDTWIEALNDLAADAHDYPIVLPGHGLPTDPSAYHDNIDWLATAIELIGTVDNAADFKQGLIDAFPELGLIAAIDFVTPFLFPEPPAPAPVPAERPSNFTTHMFGRMEVPAVHSPGVGWSTWQVDGDTMHFRMVVSRTSGDVAAAHLHQAKEGRNGPVVVPLDISDITTLDGGSASVISGVIHLSDFTADLEGRSMAALVGAIEADSIYINVHTTAHASGELRGQLS